MAYARTNEALAEQRLLGVKRREQSGRAQRPTTRAGRKADRDHRKRESEEQILSVALSQPHRRGLPKHHRDEEGRRREVDPRDPRGGHALGRLYLAGTLSRDQLQAGTRYAELFLRHGQHITGNLPRFPSQAINDTVRGIACTADLGDDEAIALRRAWGDVQSALFDTHEPHACNSALASVCVMDREPRGDTELGALRVALNVLHRLWK